MSFYQILVQPNHIKGSGVVFETQYFTFYVVVIRDIVKFIKKKKLAWFFTMRTLITCTSHLQLLQCKKPLCSVTVSIYFFTQSKITEWCVSTEAQRSGPWIDQSQVDTLMPAEILVILTLWLTDSRSASLPCKRSFPDLWNAPILIVIHIISLPTVQ